MYLIFLSWRRSSLFLVRWNRRLRALTRFLITVNYVVNQGTDFPLARFRVPLKVRKTILLALLIQLKHCTVICSAFVEVLTYSASSASNKILLLDSLSIDCKLFNILNLSSFTRYFVPSKCISCY